MIGAAFRFLRMRRNLRMSPVALARLQDARVRRLVDHAFRNVPYYRRRMQEAGLAPADVRTAADLKKLPVTTRADLQRTPVSERLAAGVDMASLKETRTSGSTGVPISGYVSRREWLIDSLLYFRAHLENGYRPTEIMAGLARLDPPLPVRAGLLQRAGLFRRALVSIFDPIEKRVEELERLRPGLLWGTKSSLEIAALHALDRGRRLPAPRLLVTGGEVLDDRARRAIAAGFGVDPHNYYGNAETGFIAWECDERRGLHVNADHIHLEIGPAGEAICTNLFAFASPVIRYDLGDLVVPSRRVCPCGRTLPLIEEVKGRVDDVVVLPDGRRVDPVFFDQFLTRFSALRQFRVIQESPRRLRVLLAADALAFAEIQRAFRQKALPDLAGMTAAFERHDVLEPDPSGKRRSVISKVGARTP